MLKRRLLGRLPMGLPGPGPGGGPAAAGAEGSTGGSAGRARVLSVALFEWDAVAGDAAAEADWLRARVAAALAEPDAGPGR